jgi:hypothetical protein
MDAFSNIRIEQCEAARGIRDDWGTRKALGYLIGEKLVNYILGRARALLLGGATSDKLL